MRKHKGQQDPGWDGRRKGLTLEVDRQKVRQKDGQGRVGKIDSNETL